MIDINEHFETSTMSDVAYHALKTFAENDLDISYLHVFTYSERADTKMLEIEHNVAIKERKRRSDLLHSISDEKTKAFYGKQIGKSAKVLWESKRDGDVMHGFTENYVRVERMYDKKMVNMAEKVTLGEWNADKTALVVG